MTQLSNQAGLSTDMYSATPSAATPKTGITPNQKKMAAIAAATLLLGGATAMVVNRTRDIGSKQPGKRGGDEVPGEDTQSPVNLPAKIDVAGKVTDSMSFEQAFSAAREEVGMGGVFSWHGHWYNTFEKDEWTGLSLEQRQQYTEMITGEKLPVNVYHPQHANGAGVPAQPMTQSEPTIIEGYLNGQRVMGLDFDQDGVIDTVVMDGPDGQTYRVVDASGDERLDTMYRYDSLDGQLTGAIVLDHPFVLSNDDFSQGLEATMSKEVVESILQSDDATSTPHSSAGDDAVNEPEDTENIYLASSSEPDDTYVNDGDVRDMDE